MDMSQLSDEDLEAISNNDMSKVSDSGLSVLAGPQSMSEGAADIPILERMKVKALAQSPDVGAEYLKSKGYNAGIENGEIAITDKSGKKQLLDPSSFEMADIADLAYDIPAGLVQGAATAGSGLLGAGTVVGAIPAAMAGSAASGAGLEALRQKLGQWAGLPQKVSGKDVAVAGGLGAASPIVFGTGAQAIKGLAPEIARSQRSVLTRSLENIGLPVLSGASGMSKEAIKGYAKHGATVDDMIANEGAADFSAKVYSSIDDALSKKRNQIGKSLEKTIVGSPNLVNKNKIFEPIEEEIQKLVKSELSVTPKVQAKINALRQEIANMSDGLPDEISAETAWRLKNQLREAGGYNPSASDIEKGVARSMSAASKAADKQLDAAAKTAGQMKEYSNLKTLETDIDKYFKNPEKTYQTLGGIERPSKEFQRSTAKKIQSELGVDVKTPGEILEAYRYFRAPEYIPSGLDVKGIVRGVAGPALKQTMQMGRNTPQMIKGTAKGISTGLPLSSPWLQLTAREKMEKK